MDRYFTPDKQTSSANAVNIKTYTAIDGVTHVIHWVVFSYSADPTGGHLQIEDDGTVIFYVDIAKAGPGPIDFGDNPIAGTNGKELRVIMSAGSGSITSTMNIAHSQK